LKWIRSRKRAGRPSGAAHGKCSAAFAHRSRRRSEWQGQIPSRYSAKRSGVRGFSPYRSLKRAPTPSGQGPLARVTVKRFRLRRNGTVRIKDSKRATGGRSWRQGQTPEIYPCSAKPGSPGSRGTTPGPGSRGTAPGRLSLSSCGRGVVRNGRCRSRGP